MTPERDEPVRPPAIVAARSDGTVVGQNAPARAMMKKGLGRPCWEVVGGLPDADGLPCSPGCVRDLIQEGVERTRQSRVTLRGQRNYLTCVPIKDHAVCILSAKGSCCPEARQFLTEREQEVLTLLAAGDETPAIAKKLNLSDSTIRTHVEKMRAKFGIGTRAGLVALGFRFGYLS